MITDPPYSSGGATLSERAVSTAEKYTNTKRNCPFPDFAGDQMDARSWLHMMADVFADARVRCHDGAILVAFCDWRQMPLLSDAVQWAGWMWRGTIVWDKLSSRPQRGRFRQQAEFAIWASNGKLPIDRPVPVLPGVFQQANVQGVKRLHQTQKPLELMRSICKICIPGGRILDPFAGSGSTLEAAELEGYDAIGVELSPEIAKTASERLKTPLREIQEVHHEEDYPALSLQLHAPFLYHRHEQFFVNDTDQRSTVQPVIDQLLIFGKEINEKERLMKRNKCNLHRLHARGLAQRLCRKEDGSVIRGLVDRAICAVLYALRHQFIPCTSVAEAQEADCTSLRIHLDPPEYDE